MVKSALPRSQASAHTWSARFSTNGRARSWSPMPSFLYRSRHPRSVARFARPASKYAESWHRQHQGDLWVIVQEKAQRTLFQCRDLLVTASMQQPQVSSQWACPMSFSCVVSAAPVPSVPSQCAPSIVGAALAACENPMEG